jgi:hypothetical protein
VARPKTLLRPARGWQTWAGRASTPRPEGEPIAGMRGADNAAWGSTRMNGELGSQLETEHGG